MKRMGGLAALLFVAVLFAVDCGRRPSQTQGTDYLRGDVNLSGGVHIDDLVKLVYITHDEGELYVSDHHDRISMVNADFNANGVTLEYADIVAFSKYIFDGIQPCLGCASDTVDVLIFEDTVLLPERVAAELCFFTSDGDTTVHTESLDAHRLPMPGQPGSDDTRVRFELARHNGRVIIPRFEPPINMLHRATPDPTHGSTAFGWQMAKREDYRIVILDEKGRSWGELCGTGGPGFVSRKWSAAGCPDGVYYYRLEIGKWHDIRRLFVFER